MIRQAFRAIAPAVLVTGALFPVGDLACTLLSTAAAQEVASPATTEALDGAPAAQQFDPAEAAPEAPARLAQSVEARPISSRVRKGPSGDGPPAPADLAPPAGGRYPQLDAPLYPCPRPNIPIGTGMTVITNPALAPHEMLHCHSYKSVYPPYYYRVRGFWYWTPVGMKSFETWELQATTVEVKYNTKYGLFSQFYPPSICGHHWDIKNYNH